MSARSIQVTIVRLISIVVLASVVGLLPGAGRVRAAPGSFSLPMPIQAPSGLQQPPSSAPPLILAETVDLSAVPALLDGLTRANQRPAALCLPTETLAGADAALEQIVARGLRPSLLQQRVPVCLTVRPVDPGDLAADDGAAERLQRTVTRARAVLGADVHIDDVRLDLAGVAPNPEEAGAFTALVSRVAREQLPNATVTVVFGDVGGVDARRPSGASAYLMALGRWLDRHHPQDGPADLALPSVSLALDRLPPRVVGLAQDWLRVRHLAPGVQVTADAAAEPALRALRLAGGAADPIAVRLSGERAQAATLAPMLAALHTQAAHDPLPWLELREAPTIALPGPTWTDGDERQEPYAVDSNSPVHWDGDTLYVFTSVARPRRAVGHALDDLGPADPVEIRGPDGGPTAPGSRWLEATYQAPGGALYGWYHEEPPDACSGSGLRDTQVADPKIGLLPAWQTARDARKLTSPRIGAMVSDDNGESWRNLGIIMEAPEADLICTTENYFFSGGLGDFSVLADRDNRYLYILTSSYSPDPAQQGVGVARISRADLDDPVDRVWRWGDDGWTEPGLGGRGAMLYPVAVNWHRGDAFGFWGPTIHWNTYLDQYVILMNRAGDADFSQEGAYVSFAQTLDDPLTWTVPQKWRAGGDWYAEAIGLDARAHETDKSIGQRARYFEHGVSRHELVFHRRRDQASS
ncbi:MAG: hypothetical protein U0893_26385 [Chloroflexota bacterium]